MREKLPKTWAWARLDQVATIVAGNPAPQGSEYFDGGEYNFVRVHDMGENSNWTHLKRPYGRGNIGCPEISADKNETQRLRAEGRSLREIAEQVGISHTKVAQVIAE